MGSLLQGGPISIGFGDGIHKRANGFKKISIRNNAHDLPFIDDHKVMKFHFSEYLLNHLEGIIHLNGDDPRGHNGSHRFYS